MKIKSVHRCGSGFDVVFDDQRLYCVEQDCVMANLTGAEQLSSVEEGEPYREMARPLITYFMLTGEVPPKELFVKETHK